MPKKGDKFTDAQGQEWRFTEGNKWRLYQNGKKTNTLTKDANPPGAPAAGGPAPGAAPGVPTSSGPFDFGAAFSSKTALDQTAFSELQRRSEAEGRRITLQEWTSAGGSPYEYHKLYGSPDQAAITAFINQAQAQNRRVTLEEFLAAGGDPNNYHKLYGENNPDPVRMAELQARAKAEGRRVSLQEWITAGGNPWSYEQQTAQTPYDASIAKQGTKTDGTELGDVREINPAKIADTDLVGKTDIAPVVNATNDLQTLEAQRAFAAKLEEQAAGRGPSVAGLQLQQALERSLKNQMGALAANPAISSALAARLFRYGAAEAQQKAANDAAQARITEQLNAQTGLRDLYNQMQSEGTRVNLANSLAANTQNYNQAQLYQEAAIKNAAQKAAQAKEQALLNQEAAKSNQTAFNTANISQGQITGGVTQAQLQAAAAVAAAEAAAEATKEAAETNANAAVTISAQNNANDVNPTVPGPTSDDELEGPGNPTTTGSDKRMKKNIKDGGSEARDMLEHLAAAIFEYKNKSRGDGEQVGVMAQDLEKSKLGKQMVDEKGGEKWVNFAKGLGAVLAAQADLNKRMKKIEARA